MIVDDQWLYLPQPVYGGAWCWTPVAWCDHRTGCVYSLIGGLTNHEAGQHYDVAVVRQWARSPAGLAALAAGWWVASREIARLRAARRVDPAMLDERVTI